MQARKQRLLLCVLCGQNTPPISLYPPPISTLPLYVLYGKISVHHRVHRVVTAAFWCSVHSIMRVKLAQACEGGGGGGARPPPFTTFTITSKVAVYTPAEWADTLTLFHFYQYMYSMVYTFPLHY